MSADEKREPELSYFISEKPPFAVVIFIGSITKATLGVLEACQKELSNKVGTLYVIAFRDVTAVDSNAIAPLARLQKMLRDKGALRICSIKPEVKKFLVEKAAIRDGEYANNLTEALESLKVAHANPIKPDKK